MNIQGPRGVELRGPFLGSAGGRGKIAPERQVSNAERLYERGGERGRHGGHRDDWKSADMGAGRKGAGSQPRKAYHPDGIRK
jgi:hypothetical protein